MSEPRSRPARIGDNGGPRLDDPPKAERRAAALQLARAHVWSLESAAHNRRCTWHSLAEKAAVARFPHRERDCCFQIGRSGETTALREAYVQELDRLWSRHGPVIERLERKAARTRAHYGLTDGRTRK